MGSFRSRLVAGLLVTVFLVGLMPAASALPTPGFFGPQAEAATGRYFPEALETNDYVGYFEAMDGLAYLEANYPGWVTVKTSAKSFGLNNLVTQSRDVFDLPVVEVTNPDSDIPYENRVQILIMLSIHGNEKGAREGGLRIIEDFAKDIGMSQWPARNGASEGTYRDYLDFMTLVFLFANADGWAHDEPQYLTGTVAVNPTPGSTPVALNCGNGVVFYCRTNGNGVDLNREMPTMGWQRARHTALSEPESQGYANFILENYHNLVAATDIHGMLANDHFVLTMLPAAAMDPQEMVQATRLSEMLKERLNSDPYFDVYRNSPEVPGAWGGQFNEWGTVWDTIGYVDSGFSGDWMAQNEGLNAPGFDIELAYNHLTFDSQYELGMYFNDMHIQSVRQIVAVFMDGVSQDLQTAIEVHGTRTAVLANPTVVTNVDDDKPLDGWAAENEFDDAWDYAHVDFFAAPQDYFREMKPFLKDGDVPAVFDELNRVDLTPTRLARYDNLIIPGTAFQQIADQPVALQVVQEWVAAGGNLVLTDSALQYLEASGLVAAGSVDETKQYAGYTNFFDRSDAMVSNVRGIARQTYEPMPLGFSIEGNSAPNWYVSASAVTDGATTWGWIGDEAQINLGELVHGEGTVRFLGALLPDPTEEFYHPYGLESYATTYSGNQLLRNLLGWEQVFEAPPALITDAGVSYTPPVGARGGTNAGDEGLDAEEDVPGPGALLVIGLFAAVAVAMARRRR